jgi:SPP1 family predicted phage head-tail adaptor
MQAGKMDRRVTLQSRSVERNVHGEQVVTYTDLATVSAQKMDPRGREFFAAQQTQAEVTTRWRIRYRSDLTVMHRLVYDGLAYDIVQVSEMGRRAGLELFTTAAAT